MLDYYINEVGSGTLLVVVNRQWVLTALDKYTVDKKGDTISSGNFTFNGTAKVYVQTPAL